MASLARKRFVSHHSIESTKTTTVSYDETGSVTYETIHSGKKIVTTTFVTDEWIKKHRPHYMKHWLHNEK